MAAAGTPSPSRWSRSTGDSARLQLSRRSRFALVHLQVCRAHKPADEGQATTLSRDAVRWPSLGVVWAIDLPRFGQLATLWHVELICGIQPGFVAAGPTHAAQVAPSSRGPQSQSYLTPLRLG